MCKQLVDLRVVIDGLTPAATAMALLVAHAGAADVRVVDDDYVVHTDDLKIAFYTRARVAGRSNQAAMRGTLHDALKGADVFLRFGAGAIGEGALRSMAQDPIVFSLADATVDDEGGDAVARVATISAGNRTSETNMITSALVFPGVMRGMIKHGVGHIDLPIATALAEALASSVSGGVDTNRLLPTVSDMRVPKALAAAVGRYTWVNNRARDESVAEGETLRDHTCNET